MVQWLGIHLAAQGPPVQALVRDDPTCLRETKPLCHNYRAQALQLPSPSTAATEARALQLPSPSTAATEPEHCRYRAQALQLPKPVLHSTEAHALQLERSPGPCTREKPEQQRKHSTAKNNNDDERKIKEKVQHLFL